MAKIEKTIVPDSTGKGSVEVTKVTHEEYPLKENENKKKEYKSNEELQRDRFSAFDAAKEDAWIPDTSKPKVEVVTEFTTVHNDHSKDYVDRNRTPKKTVKLFVALRLVRKSAKYHGVMRLSDLTILAQKVLVKYKELKTAAGSNPIADITKHPDIKTYIEQILTKYIADKKTITDGAVVPPPSAPTEVSHTVTFKADGFSAVDGAAQKVVIVKGPTDPVSLATLTFPVATIKTEHNATKKINDDGKWKLTGSVTGNKTEAEIKALSISGDITITVITAGK